MDSQQIYDEKRNISELTILKEMTKSTFYNNNNIKIYIEDLTLVVISYKIY